MAGAIELKSNIMMAKGKLRGCVAYAPLFQVGSQVMTSAGKKSCIPRRPALGNGEEINGTTPRMASEYCTAHCQAWRPPYETPMTATSSRTSSASARSRFLALHDVVRPVPSESSSGAIARLAGFARADAIGGDDEVLPVSRGCPRRTCWRPARSRRRAIRRLVILLRSVTYSASAAWARPIAAG